MVKNITFIGSGNMSEAILHGLLKVGYSPQHCTMTGRTLARLERFNPHRVNISTDNAQAVKNADIVILAVKPFQAIEAMASIQATLPKQTLVISVMAGVRWDKISQALNSHQRIVCAMPNTAVWVQAGMTGLFSPHERDLAEANEVLEPLGHTIAFANEALIDSLIGISGSGPAYLMWVLEQWILNVKDPQSILLAWEEMATLVNSRDDFAHQLQKKLPMEKVLYLLILQGFLQGGRLVDLEEKTAFQLALATGHGTVQLIKKSDAAISTLRGNITSKGGTTQAALNVLAPFDWPAFFEYLERNAKKYAVNELLTHTQIALFCHTIEQAVLSARNRSQELANIL